MLLFLSSNAQQRFVDDIVRALALPEGAELQFRYDADLIDDEVRKRISRNALHGETGLVCYLSTGSTHRRPAIIPCRLVRVVASEVIGSTYVFTLAAQAFVAGLNDAELRSLLAERECSLLPAWQSRQKVPARVDLPARLTGQLVVQTNAELVRFGTVSFESFRDTAKLLGRQPGFKTSPSLSFFTIRDIARDHLTIFGNRKQEPVGTQQGVLRLQGGGRYRCRVYCVAPTRNIEPPSLALRMAGVDKAIQMTSPADAQIDSTYDLKSFSFATEERDTSAMTALRLAISGPAGDRFDVILPAHLKGNRTWTVFRMLIVAAGVGGPAAKIADEAGKLGTTNLAIIAMGALAAAAATVIKSPKPS